MKIQDDGVQWGIVSGVTVMVVLGLVGTKVCLANRRRTASSFHSFTCRLGSSLPALAAEKGMNGFVLAAVAQEEEEEVGAITYL